MTKTKNQSKHASHQRYQRAAQDYLVQRGYCILNPSPRNPLVIVTPQGKQILAHVCGLRYPNGNFVPLHEPLKAEFYIVVQERPGVRRFFLLTRRQVQAEMRHVDQLYEHRARARGKIHVPGLNWNRLQKFENCWARLPR
jgi:hypothetical protein